MLNSILRGAVTSIPVIAGATCCAMFGIWPGVALLSGLALKNIHDQVEIDAGCLTVINTMDAEQFDAFAAYVYKDKV